MNIEIEPLSFQGYVVSIFDVLGQKEAIRKLADYNGSEKSRQLTIDALKNSLGTRNDARTIFTNAFNSLNKPSANPLLNQMTPEQRETYSRFAQYQMKMYGFSDTFIAHFPLMTRHRDPNLHDIYAALCASAMTMQVCLAGRTALRGGVELGWGIEWDDDEIYGPAFLHAYELCEYVAQHPRVVLGKEMIGYLQGLCQMTPSSPLEGIQKKIANVCWSLIAVDEDGAHIVDYLGPAAHDIFKGESGDLVPRGLAFAREMHQKFVNCGAHKLASRYANLRRYYECNCKPWIKQPS